MKTFSLAVAAATLLSLAALSAPAKAQSPGPFIRAQLYNQPAALGYGARPEYDPRWDQQRRWEERRRWEEGRRAEWRHGHGYGDNDHVGVPNRYDRSPGNPYRF